MIIRATVGPLEHLKRENQLYVMTMIPTSFSLNTGSLTRI